MGFNRRYVICVVGAALFATSVGFTLPWRGVQAQKAEVADIKTCSGHAAVVLGSADIDGSQDSRDLNLLREITLCRDVSCMMLALLYRDSNRDAGRDAKQGTAQHWHMWGVLEARYHGMGIGQFIVKMRTELLEFDKSNQKPTAAVMKKRLLLMKFTEAQRINDEIKILLATGQ